MSFLKQQQQHPIAYDDPNELINQVIATLSVPSETEDTFVSRQYHNSKNDQNEIQLYLKIAGRDWTYFVKTLNVSIGRNTENSSTTSQQQLLHNIHEQLIAIDLGPSKVVSRKHAEIMYNSNLKRWMLRAYGRNGLKVDGVRVSNPGPDSEPILLESGNIIDIGGTQMMFILPDCSPVIAKQFLDNLKDKKLVKNANGGYDALPTGNGSNGHSNHLSNGTNGNGSVSSNGPPVTNNLRLFQIFNKSQINDGETHSSSPGSKIGEQDLSKDESKDIKPPFSYATMITQLILTNPEGILSLSEIYDWISSHYAYYRHSKSGWQNSIRHNLSLNKLFDKVPRKPNEPGKGMKWCIAPLYKNEFMKKWESGGIKARRGSSVTRQLQIHLMKNKKLPDDQVQPYHTLKLNPQLPQIRNIGSMPPPFQQTAQQQQQQQQLQQQQQQQLHQQQQQQLPLLLPPSHSLNLPQLQLYPNYIQRPYLQPAAPLASANDQYSFPLYNSQSNGNNHMKLSLPAYAAPNHDSLLSTPSRGGKDSNGLPTSIMSNSNGSAAGVTSKLPNGLSSPQLPLSAERGGPGRGFGDFVYSSPTKENNIDMGLGSTKLH